MVLGTAVVIGAGLLLAGGALAFLTLTDLGRHRALIEDRLSRVLGYEVAFDQLSVDLDLHGPSSVVARGVTLSNPSSAADPLLVAVDRLDAGVELWPLLEGCLHVRHLEVDGARVTLVRDDAGGSSWDLSRPARESDAPAVAAGAPEVVVDRARFTDLAVTVRSPSLSRPLGLRVAALELSTTAEDRVDLRLEGSFDGQPVALDGTVGPLAELLVAGRVDARLELLLTRARASLRAAAESLAGLEGLSFELSAEGPSTDEITSLLRLPSFGDEAFQVAARAETAGETVGIGLEAVLGELEATVEGETDSLTSPARVEAQFRAVGPDLAAAGTLAGLEGLPEDGFEISGRAVWSGFPLTLEGVVLQVGDSRLTVDGVVGGPPALVGTDLVIEGGGPDAGAIAALLGLTLPASPYRLSGRVRREGSAILLEAVEAEIGSTRVEIAGTVGEPPALRGTDLTVHAEGPSLVPYRDLARLELPDLPFRVDARILPDGDVLEVQRAEVRVGTSSARIAGRISTSSRLTGSELQLEAEGDDLSGLAWAVGGLELPSSPFALEGGLAIHDDRVSARAVRATLDRLELALDGRIGLGPHGDGTDVELEIAGPDLSRALALAGVESRAALPFSASGPLRIVAGRVESDGVEARVGGLELTASGSAPLTRDLEGATLVFDGRGPRFAELGPVVTFVGLPEAPFTVAGSVQVEAAGFRFGPTTATVSRAHRVELEGLVTTGHGLVGSDLTVTASGPDLGQIARLLEAVGPLPDLPGDPYSVAVEGSVQPDGAKIRTATATLGAASASISGFLGPWPDLHGSDLTVDLRGPDLSRLAGIAAIPAPADSFELSGGVKYDPDGIDFRSLSARAGGYRVWVDGHLGEPPKLIGSDLRFRAEGPGLELAELLLDREGLPDLPFAVAGHALGSPRQLRVDDLEISFGGSDVRGSGRLGLEGRPRLDVRLESQRLDLDEVLLSRLPGPDAEAAPEPEPTPDRTRVLSQETFDLALLDRFDADVAWNVEVLRLLGSEAADIDLTAILEGGRLEVGPLEAVGERGGRLSARFLLEPGENGRRLDAHLTVDSAQARLARSEQRASSAATNVDLRLDVSAVGVSPHQLAAAADGRVVLSLAGGAVDSSLFDLIGADLVLSLLRALNPFRETSTGLVALECAVILGEIDDGLLVLEPIVAKSENLAIVGHGTVDLDTERLDFEWVTKPRKGLGISATTLTNPYVKLGGTLARPAIGVKGVEGLTSTGIAVATGGLSLLGKGLLDRVTAERKVCQKALEEASRRLAGEAARRRSRRFR